MKSAEIARELEDIDAMSDELERDAEVSPPSSSPSDTEESSVPRGDQEPVGEQAPDPTVPLPELSSSITDEDGRKQHPSIEPQTGDLLSQTSGALDLIMHGLRAGIVRTGITEKDDQLGHLSMIMATLKKAKDQADRLLGK